MPVDLRSEQRRVRLSAPRLKKDAQVLLEALGLQGKTLSVLLTDDRRMARLHERWLGRKGPTDVMSFPVEDAAPLTEAAPSSPPRECRGAGATRPDMLGDIVISVETAARRRPAAPAREVRRYLVHGLLHLAGHDHRLLAQRRRMRRRERRLRNLLEG